jgi:hypothetical protein
MLLLLLLLHHELQLLHCWQLPLQKQKQEKER